MINTTFQRVENITPMSNDTRELVRQNALQFYVKKQGQGQGENEPEGITALYSRLSQEDKNDGESNSIANQKKILERYCKEKGYTAIRHYDKDDGYSGTNFNRPDFQRMLADIKAGKIARVVVKDMSRLGRDYLQVGMYTDIVFPEYGVHFIAVSDSIDSTRGENEFAAIRNVFNEMFARDTSKKIRATWQSKGKSGERLSSNPPYGYEKCPTDKKKWIIDEEAATVVQKIFALCMDGKGPTQIATWLRNSRIITPTVYYKAKGKATANKAPYDPYKWAEETVSKILERMEYLGHTINFKTTKQSYKSKKVIYNDPDNWAIFENTHEPIIEESTFAIVQNLRKSRKRPTKMGDMGVFSGLLFCEDCGAKMRLCRTTYFKPEQAYYVCGNYRKDKELCTTHTIRNVILEDIVLQNLREAIAYVKAYEKDFIREAAELSEKTQNNELAASKKALGEADKRIVELDTIIKRLYEDNITGKLTDERFIKLSREYELEQTTLKATAEAKRQELQQQEQKKGNVKSFIAATKKYTDLKELDATVLREFIDRIEISATEKWKKKEVGRKIYIVYNFIGAFDFGVVKEEAEIAEITEAKTAETKTTNNSKQRKSA